MGMDGLVDGPKSENDKASGEPGAHNVLNLGCRINQAHRYRQSLQSKVSNYVELKYGL